MDIIPPYQPLHRAILTGQSARAIQRIIRTDRTSSAKSIITKHSILVHYQPQHRTLSDDDDEEDEDFEEMVGETALHLLVYKILYDGRMDMAIGAFHDLVQAFPEASGVLDGEGDSPFSLTLTCPRLLPHCHCGNSHHRHDNGGSTRISTQQQQEQQADDRREELILTMIQTMINANPTITYQTGNDEWDNNALHHALMCHRHTSIVRAILTQNPHTLVNTNFRGELPLHVACKSKSPCEVIEALVGAYPEGCGVQDTQGLTPLHWAWIRHVAGPGEEGHVVPDNYEELMLEADHCIHEEEEGGIAEFRNGFLGRNGGLFWETTEVLLRAAAANLVLVDHEEEYQIPSWRIVHTAASAHCPRAVLRIAIKLHPHQLRERDENGKLPLHLAAAAASSFSHHATTTNTIQPWIFRGVFGQPLGPQILEENLINCLLRNCPEAARIADYEFRLPLHIAIDTEKKLLHAAAANAKENQNHHHQCAEAAFNVRTILTAYPEAIRRKDGLSRLYPFMLAAVHSTHHHRHHHQQHHTTNHTNQSFPTTPHHQSDTTMHQQMTTETPPNHSSHKTQLSTNQDFDQGTTVLQQSEEADINMDEVQTLLNCDNQSLDGMSDIFISNQFPLDMDSSSQQEQPQQKSVSSDDELDYDSLSSSSSSSSSSTSSSSSSSVSTSACQPANKDNTRSSLNNTNDAICNLSTIYELFRACPDFVRDITSKHDKTQKHKSNNHYHIPKSKKAKYKNP